MTLYYLKINIEKTSTVQSENANPPIQNQNGNNYQNVNQPRSPYNNTQNYVTSTGGWIGWILLISFLSIIGVIIMLVTTQDPSAKNFAKAYLILFAVCAGTAIVILLLIFLIIGVMVGSYNF